MMADIELEKAWKLRSHGLNVDLPKLNNVWHKKAVTIVLHSTLSFL